MITELTLRLQAIPEHAAADASASRRSRRPARQRLRGGGGAGVTRSSCSTPGRRRDQRVLRDLVPRDTLPVRRIDRQPGDGAADLELVREIALAEGATEIVAEEDPDARAASGTRGTRPPTRSRPSSPAVGSGRPTSASRSPSSPRQRTSPGPSSGGRPRGRHLRPRRRREPARERPRVSRRSVFARAVVALRARNRGRRRRPGWYIHRASTGSG